MNDKVWRAFYLPVAEGSPMKPYRCSATAQYVFLFRAQSGLAPAHEQHACELLVPIPDLRRQLAGSTSSCSVVPGDLSETKVL